MQYFTNNFKNSLFNFKNGNFNHDYIFQMYMKFLLNFINDLINKQLNYVQTFNKTRQLNNQSIRKFEIYLTNLKIHLMSYNKKQQITHLFTKLRFNLRDVVTNYQNFFKIKT